MLAILVWCNEADAFFSWIFGYFKSGLDRYKINHCSGIYKLAGF